MMPYDERINNCKKACKHRWPFILIAVLAGIHILGWIQVDGYGLVLIVLASLPATLPLVARYIEWIKLGKDGVEANIRADSEGKPVDEIHPKTMIAANSAPIDKENIFGEFSHSLRARRILATLWHYQTQLFGSESPRRWGFGVGLGSPQYEDFRAGAEELREAGLVHIDSRGLSYLTNEGIEFCIKHKDVIEADGPYFSRFAPASDQH